MDTSHDIRFKAKTVRLLSSVLAGSVLLLLFGVLGVGIMASLVSALAVAALVFIGWLLIMRLYTRLFRARA
jgi:biotin transporter BioY